MTSQASTVSAAVVRQRKEGGWLFGVVGKRTYQVDRGRCRVAALQTPLVTEPRLDEETGALLHDSDLIITRQAVDLIVVGQARAPRPQPSFTVSLRVGDFFREVLVFGERRLQLHANGDVSFSSPASTEAVPLTWEHAYGGVDRAGLAEIGDPFVELAAATDAPIAPTQSLFAYPRNPFGRGYLIEPSPTAIDACRLPNLEYAWSRVTPENVVRRHYVTWPNAPLPAGLGWLSYAVFPRCSQLGLPAPLYDNGTILPENFHEVKTRVLQPVALDPERAIGDRLDVAGVAQGAALGMRAASVLPGSLVQLSNAHPTQPVWSLALPAEVPRMAYRLPGQKADELVPQIRCLLLDPEQDSVSVLWAATRPIDVPLTPVQLEAIEHGVIWG